jgi:hypothetical protein
VVGSLLSSEPNDEVKVFSFLPQEKMKIPIRLMADCKEDAQGTKAGKILITYK